MELYRGGMAAVALGVPYLTQDIDFCYDTTPENRSRLIEALAPLTPRLRVEGMPDDATSGRAGTGAAE